MARPSDPNAKIDLLRAAAQVFVESGVDRARVEDITERAGRSKGSFYLHFQSKEDAFEQLVHATIAGLAEVMSEPPGSGDASLSEAEHRRMWLEKDVEIFEQLWANRGVVRLIFEGGRCASFSYLIHEFAERSRKTTERWLDWGKRRGFYRADLDVSLASLVMCGGYDRVARELVMSAKKPPIADWVAQVQSLFIEGVARANASKVSRKRGSDVEAGRYSDSARRTRRRSQRAR